MADETRRSQEAGAESKRSPVLEDLDTAKDVRGGATKEYVQETPARAIVGNMR